jgi:glycosyltransferase involved in cell wall biosynthesis
MNPLVSIILPTYKTPVFLGKAIKSVQAQTYTNWELVLIDDGLSIDTQKLVETFTKEDDRICYIKNEQNLGIQKSLNAGIRHAKGELIARIDDDDVWTDSTKLEKQVLFFHNNPEYVLVGTNARIVDEKGELLGVYSQPSKDNHIRSRILFKNCFLHPTVMFRKEVVISVGGYDENINSKHIEDYALWLKLGEKGKVANISEVMTDLTVHTNSLTSQNRLVQAKNMYHMINSYKHTYPNFLLGKIVLMLRILGFSILSIIPLPKSVLYTIQRLYKKV